MGMVKKDIVELSLEFYTYRLKFLEDARVLIINKLTEGDIDYTTDKVLSAKINELDTNIDILKAQLQDFKDTYGLD